MYLSPSRGIKRSCESDWLRSNGRSEGPVFGCSKERLLKLKSACSRTIQNASAKKSYTRGASPSMRERRINRASLCTIQDKQARRRDVVDYCGVGWYGLSSTNTPPLRTFSTRCNFQP